MDSAYYTANESIEEYDDEPCNVTDDDVGINIKYACTNKTSDMSEMRESYEGKALLPLPLKI